MLGASILKPNLLFTLLLSSAVLVVGQTKVARGSKVFISEMEGKLDGFSAPEIVKQKLPLTAVLDEKDANFVLAGASIKADDKWYHVAFGGKDKNEGNVRLLDVKEKTMVWAGEAGDRSSLVRQFSARRRAQSSRTHR